MQPQSLCIYHGNCADGFAAAWVVWKHFKLYCKKPEHEVEFHAGVYQNEPPMVTGRDVIIVDFSYKKDVMKQIIAEASSVTLLDHHKSAIIDLADLDSPKLTKVFDIERSGAMITWDHFFPDMNPPQLLEHIQDRDLWRFEKEPYKTLRPRTREIQAALFSYPYDFQLWDNMFNSTDDGGITQYDEEMFVEKLAEQGAAIERKHFKDIKELLKIVTRRMNIGGYNVPVANLPYIHSSDAGHILSASEPFAACYWDTPATRIFSLRSASDGVDVSIIAGMYGGGGHKNAAGFSVDYGTALSFEEVIPRQQIIKYLASLVAGHGQ